MINFQPNEILIKRMPLYKIINFDQFTTIYLWKITEGFDALFRAVSLKKETLARLEKMKSESHQKGFLAIRMLLQEAGYSDFDLEYDAFGKPYLNNQNHISITHSHEFSGIIISNQKTGIDIELQREKIIRIADKFVNNAESHRLISSDNQNYIRKLTIKWGAKESIFKIRNEQGISFKDHIRVKTFEIEDKKTTAILKIENVKQNFSIYFEEIENFILVYAFEN